MLTETGIASNGFSDGFTCWGAGIVTATAQGKLLLDVDGTWSWAATVGFGAGFGTGQARAQRTLQATIAVPGSASAGVQNWLIRSAAGNEGSSGVSYDSMADEWSASFSDSGGTGSLTLNYILVSANDLALDLDGDNRFSQADVDILASLVGTQDATNPTYTDYWDFDADGVITADDVAIMQALIDAWLGSGILGDYDGDGDADCNDLSSMGSGWNYVIGDGNYVVEIDADLDGDNDSSDYDAVYDLLQPADINDDGVVNTADVSAYLNLYNVQDPEADINGDGVVNTQDWTLFLNLWNNPC